MSISTSRSRWPDAAVCALALAIAGAGAPAFASDDEAELARLRSEIQDIVGPAMDCYNIVHCLVLPMGYDTCGNPSHYVGYSNRTGIRPQLEAKAAEYTFIEEEMRRGQPRPADCAPARAPVATCHRNHCAVGTPAD